MTSKPVIVCAIDFSESSDGAARVAYDYAMRLGATLHLLHVAWPEVDARATELMARHAGELGSAAPVVTALEVGMPPAPAVVRYAERHDAVLVVMGTHGRTGVTRALIGSVAERVVRTAPCPVLTVRSMPAPSVTGAAEAPAEGVEIHRCLVCAKPSEDLICEACRAHIRGEALERRRRDQRPGY